MTQKTFPQEPGTDAGGHGPVHAGERADRNFPATHPVTPSRADALAAELHGRIRGEIRFDTQARALYATDASNYRQVPIGAVIPKSVEDVIETVAACRDYGAPVLARGGGTSLAGQCCNVAVVMDMSKYLRQVLEVNAAGRWARVQPGTVLDDLRAAANEHGLTFGPDPATHNHCTLGGMIGNNSCGVHSVMAGKTVDNVEELDILTYRGLRMKVGATSPEELESIIAGGGERGAIYAQLKSLRDRYEGAIRQRMPQLPRRSSGFNLDFLLPERGFHVARALTGTECTSAIVLEAKLKLVPEPKARTLVVLGYPDVYSAADHVTGILPFGPIGLEGLDDLLIGYERKKGLNVGELPVLPPGQGWLMAEFGGDSRAESDAKAMAMMAKLKAMPGAPSMKLFDDAKEEKRLWEIREAGLGATARVEGEMDGGPGWEDAAVPPERVGAYLRDFRKLLDEFGYHASLYGHFGQGCVHCRISFDLRLAEGIRKYRAFVDRAADLVVKYGGSLSGEHGDGQARAELLPKMYGRELVQAFREFKDIWDPDHRMNPGKAIDAYPIVENLRLGLDYRPAQPATKFKLIGDEGSLSRAVERCVGVGECRRMEKGTMCPSYRATLEEKHSTRGRAHLLFEMLRGGAIKDGFRSAAVKDALDLCLSCKGCKSDCPVNVDMATYKAEFLHHHYAGRLRPRYAYGMGLIYWVARLASRLPGPVNLAFSLPLLGRALKSLGGITPRRSVPEFATLTFREWHARRPRKPVAKGDKVLLWADTFNNFFTPEVAAAACESLEELGFQVLIPERILCCGRPLYDYGMLDLAQRQLRQILDTLRPLIREGVPVVGLEPSCVSVFRDELADLFPNDEDARRLKSQAFLLEEFLEGKRQVQRLPRLESKALLHGHCHQKAIMGMGTQERILKSMGIEADQPESGCCGLAGSFGFEADKYDVSMRIGERHLLPAARGAGEGGLLIADGFSCREQVRQGAGRMPLHLAQVIHLASRGREASDRLRAEFHKGKWSKGAFWPALALGAAAAWAWRKRGRR